MSNPHHHRVIWYRSFLLRFALLIVAAQVFVVVISGWYFLNRANRAALERSYTANEVHLRVINAFVRSAFHSFSDNLVLMAATPAVASYDKKITGQMIKSYAVASLFIAGERVAVYNPNNILVADNRMVGGFDKKENSFANFSLVDPVRPLIGPVEWESNIPHKTIAVTVQNYARANGVLTAEFSLRRFYDFFGDYKIGDQGFVVMLNARGTLLYHPDARLMRQRARIQEHGLPDFKGESFALSGPTYLDIFGSSYMVSYSFDPDFQLGLLVLQPRSEIERLSAEARSSMIILMILVLIFATLLAITLGVRLVHPLRVLTEKMMLVRDGNLDVASNISRRDEIGVLAEGFDMMRISLKASIKELANHKEQLEEEVRARTKELQEQAVKLAEANKTLQLISHTDDLTGIPNRRDIMEKIHYEMFRSQRTHKPFVFLIGDIDKFKTFNDTWGHECGDYVLKTVAQAMRDLLRKHDYIARWGGEEFLIVLPETNIKDSMAVAERVRARVEATEFAHMGRHLHVTITLGVSQFDSRLGIERSIALADKALYMGKEQGRNRVVLFESSWITQEMLAEAAAALAQQTENAESPFGIKATISPESDKEKTSQPFTGPDKRASRRSISTEEESEDSSNNKT